MAYEIELDVFLCDLPKDQHGNYEWFSEESLLIHNGVHKYTKWYFQEGQNTGASFTNNH